MSKRWLTTLAVLSALALSGCFYSRTPLFDIDRADVNLIRPADRFERWVPEPESDRPASAPDLRRCAQVRSDVRLCRVAVNGVPSVYEAVTTEVGTIDIRSSTGWSLGRQVAGSASSSGVSLYRIRDHAGLSVYVTMGRYQPPYNYIYGLVVQDRDFLTYYSPPVMRNREFSSASELERAMLAFLNEAPKPSGVLVRTRP